MSERKVLTKYYPPDFDPSKITRTRGSKVVGPKTQTVRLMAPFSMKCISCGEYIYKGRKFNARKETTEEKYLSITIYRFYIRCTRCSAEITFKTDPKAMDYTCERGAKRNFEVWRDPDATSNPLETEEEMLDRIEAEQAEAGGVMAELETKVVDAKREMEIADALDEIRTRNARISRAEGREAEGEGGALEKVEKARGDMEAEKRRVEEEDEEAARRAFGRGIELDEDVDASLLLGGPVNGSIGELLAAQTGSETVASKGAMAPPPKPVTAPTLEFKRAVKKKKDFSAALGIKKKGPLV